MARAQVSLRANVEDVETRPDALISYVAAQPYAGALAGGEVTRADVLRIALTEGLRVLEGRMKQWEAVQAQAAAIGDDYDAHDAFGNDLGGGDDGNGDGTTTTLPPEPPGAPE